MQEEILRGLEEKCDLAHIRFLEMTQMEIAQELAAVEHRAERQRVFLDHLNARLTYLRTKHGLEGVALAGGEAPR